MFNTNQKNEYISCTNKSESYAVLYQKLFLKTEPFEEKLQKDVCNFIKEEIENMFIGFGAGATTSLSTYLSMLTTYADWCCMNQLSIDNINHFQELTGAMLSKYVNSFVYSDRFITRDELLLIANELTLPKDKYVLLGIYEGLGGKNFCELTDLSLDDINTKTREFSLVTGKKFIASEELLQAAIISGNTYEESSTRITYQETPLILKPRHNANFNTPSHKVTRVRATITRIQDAVGRGITATKLHKSGFANELSTILEEQDWTFDDAFSAENFEKEPMQSLVKKYDYDKAPKFQIKHIYTSIFQTEIKTDEI